MVGWWRDHATGKEVRKYMKLGLYHFGGISLHRLR